jgi:primosomal protein N' (replication factor Y)
VPDRVAKVLVDVALDREFDYHVPAHLAERVAPGVQVAVPFGRRETRGFVVGLAERSERSELKPIRAVVGKGPVISEKLLELARWMSVYYAAPVEQALRAVLPGVVRHRQGRFKERLFVTLRGAEAPAAGPAADAVAPGPCDRPAPDPTPALRLLDPLRLRAPRQADVLERVIATGGAYVHQLARAGPGAEAAVRALEKKGVVTVRKETETRDPLARHTILKTEPLPLMPQQQDALRLIAQAIDTRHPSVVLLHGVTGSGKTEVYLQAMDHVLRQGKGAIVLVPEIALTPQTLERFQGRFAGQVAVLHSGLSEGERHDEWHRLLDGRARIAVGARSAVFAPVCPLGLIVVDEEQEHTYKQDEAPRYNARDMAVMRGRLEDCAVVLGSATPALESFWNARTGKYALAAMPHRVDHRRMPAVRVVDMRVEAERTGRVSVFSRELLDAIRARLDRAEQVMLFLNRRGYATSLLCPKCGHVATCDQCCLPYTYHRQNPRLSCHLCGGLRPVPDRCPGCQDPAFKFAGVGTQRAEEAIAKLFPKAAVRRMDADTTATKDAHWHILREFRTGKIDILVGTQMIAKGLDFPNVTLIGVLHADLGMHMPDFRAGERTFQLLTQVAGRAGRGEIPGEVFVQTFTPFHPAVQAARRLDYEGFFEQEVEFRRQLQYPPFSHLVCLELRSRVEARAQFVAAALSERLRKELAPQAAVAAAAPAPLPKVKGWYRFQIMIRTRAMQAVAARLKVALQAARLPADVPYSVDVDALAIL